MSQSVSPLPEQVAQHVLSRTGRQIRNLRVEFHPEQVVLRGRAGSYYVKQLAQEGVRDLVPDLRLENAIEVERDFVLRG